MTCADIIPFKPHQQVKLSNDKIPFIGDIVDSNI